MSMTLLKIALTFLSAAAVASGYHAHSCPRNDFRCVEGSRCMSNKYFCDKRNLCNDQSDEKYCDNYLTKINGGCPLSWWKCNDGRCIPYPWKCNGFADCLDHSDEKDCDYADSLREMDCPPNKWACRDGVKCIPVEWRCDGKNNCWDGSDEKQCVNNAKKTLLSWFLQRKQTEYIDLWRNQLFRIVVALHLSKEGFFQLGHKESRGIVKELQLQILSTLTSEEDLKSNELALSIHALLVTCNDPWDFYGFNLVSELRARVELDSSRPFELLALCNARDVMTPQDAQRAADAFRSKKRPFTTDEQALALLALACIRTRTNFTLNGSNMSAMVEELKQGQFTNGTMGSLRTTALVLQALIATQSYEEDFDYPAAKDFILGSQKPDSSFGSLSDSYYVMPVLYDSSLLNINNSHCQRQTESEGLDEFQNREKISRTSISYNIRKIDVFIDQIGLRVPQNSSLYDVIEIVNVLHSNQNVQYNVVDGKPYVSSVYGVQEDLERGLYWSTYIYHQGFLIEKSPVDISIEPNEEYILYYEKK